MATGIGDNIQSSAKWVFENALFGVGVAIGSAFPAESLALAPLILVAIVVGGIALTIIESSVQASKALTAMTIMGGSALAIFSTFEVLSSEKAGVTVRYRNMCLAGAGVVLIGSYSLLAYGAYHIWKLSHPPKKSWYQW